jgi:hypothetical protein
MKELKSEAELSCLFKWAIDSGINYSLLSLSSSDPVLEESEL